MDLHMAEVALLVAEIALHMAEVTLRMAEVVLRMAEVALRTAEVGRLVVAVGVRSVVVIGLRRRKRKNLRGRVSTGRHFMRTRNRMNWPGGKVSNDIIYIICILYSILYYRSLSSFFHISVLSFFMNIYLYLSRISLLLDFLTSF